MLTPSSSIEQAGIVCYNLRKLGQTIRMKPGVLLVVASVALNASAITRYVNLNNPVPNSPYLDWATAATNIQDAIDVAGNEDLILVTNGVYLSQGRSAGGTTNSVVVDKPVTIQSLNGGTATLIDGRGMMRGAYLTNGAKLDGFTITNCSAPLQDGGGVLCSSTNALVANCLIIGNTSGYGGGIANGTVSNCVLKANSSTGSGGGARSCLIIGSVLVQNSAGFFGGGASGGISALNSCLVISNYAAEDGGGVFGSLLSNCIVVSNRTLGLFGGTLNCPMNGCVVVGNFRFGVGNDQRIGTLVPMTLNTIIYYNASGNFSQPAALRMTNCCTTPLPTSGFGNFTNQPALLNLASGDFHLQPNSPCINAGNNSMVTSAFDLDGNTRIVGGTVDVGAYEFQSPSSQVSYAWLQRYGLPTDGSADFADPDTDGMNNHGEWRSDTIPTNSLSVLKMLSATDSAVGANVMWTSVATRSYWLERTTNPVGVSAFHPIATNIAGNAGTKTFTDTTATNGGPYFYRVGVQ